MAENRCRKGVSVCLCVCARGIEGDGGISVPLGSYAGLGIGH